MKVLLTGVTGQLGQALLATRPEEVALIAPPRCELDLTDVQACRLAVQAVRPDWVINAGAYTAVDLAEREPELAHAVNAQAPEAFAEALDQFGGRMLQLSTDFVFGGHQGNPYRPEQCVDPLGVYGASKAAGENAVLQLPGARILRTSWLYGPVGTNFCRTMLRLHALKAASGEPLGVVADQVGCPTSTHTLAAVCWRVIGLDTEARQPDGEAGRILHWSDAGAASWYDFAVAIGELGVATGVLEQMASVVPLTSREYPTAAQRPAYSLLDCMATRQALGLEPVNWRQSLAAVLTRMREPIG